MNQYKVGDRVMLVTNGGYGCFKSGEHGTVVSLVTDSGVMVEVDGDVERYPRGLCFYNREVKPAGPEAKDFPLEYEDRDGDPVIVMSNGAHNNELYVKTRYGATGSVLTKEQALELAAAINKFYRTH